MDEYTQMPTVDLAKKLLGRELVRFVNGQTLSGMIVEVEAYLGPEDRAAHSYGGRRTNRTEVMFHHGGVFYVYFIYGKNYCLNVVSAEEGVPHAILIRAIEPIQGIDQIAVNRFGTTELSKQQLKNLTNGPGKLCKALNIDKEQNGVSVHSDELFIREYKEIPPEEIKETKRIGIDYAGEATEYPWRFYIKGNPNISRV